MGNAFGQLVMILLSLSGIGVQKNANAPAASEVLKYAPEDADAVAYVDVETLVPGNYKVLSSLPDNATVKANADLAKEVKMGLAHVEEMRAKVKEQVGFDPVTDVKTAAVFVTIRDNQEEPDFLVVVRGNFGKDLVDTLGKKFGGMAKADKIDGRTILSAENMAIATGADGALLLGSAAWVKDRAATAWKPAKGKKGSLIAGAAKLLDKKPFFFIASAPSDVFRKRVSAELKDPDAAIVADFLTQHDYAAVAINWNGIAWTYAAKTDAGYDRAVLGSEGVLAIMRAGHLATRGIIDLLLATADSYAGANQMVAQVAQNKEQILKLVDQWTGDGSFTAKVDKQKGAKTVSVEATGKHLSEVVPIVGVLVPVGAMAAFGMRKKEAASRYDDDDDNRIQPARPAKKPR